MIESKIMTSNHIVVMEFDEKIKMLRNKYIYFNSFEEFIKVI